MFMHEHKGLSLEAKLIIIILVLLAILITILNLIYPIRQQ
jgi:hypothetical protein